MSEYILVGFGWLLGILSPAVVERVRRGYRAKEILRGLAVELHDLRFRLALAVLHVRRRNASLTVDEVRRMKPLLEAVRDQADRREFAAPTLKLIEKGEDEYVRLANAGADSTKSALAPEERAPYLTHVLGEVTLLSPSQQEIVLRIDSEIRLYNNQVAIVRQMHERTFDAALTSDNHRINRENLEAATQKLGDRARIIVDQVSRLLTDSGAAR